MPVQEKVFPGEGGRGVDSVVELVGGERLQLIRALQHDRRTIAAYQVDPPGCPDRRGVHALQSVDSNRIYQNLAGLRIEAGKYTCVARKAVDSVAVQQRRMHVGSAPVDLPCDCGGTCQLPGPP